MSTTSQRFFVSNVGSNVATAKRALSAAIQICKQNGWHLTVITATAGDFPHTVFGGIFAPQKTGQTKNYDGISISVDIPRNLRMTSYDMLFGAHLSLPDMEKLDATNAKAIFYVPWMENDGPAWVNRWNPQVIGESKIQYSQNPLNPLVVRELERITRVINLSTGLTHPSDKQIAEAAFKELARSGQFESSEAIRDWALQNSWNPRHVDKLVKLAEKYFK